MPKFLVANHDCGGSAATPSRLVATSIGNLKVKLKDHPGTEWLVSTYNVKADLPTICQLVEDISLVPCTSQGMSVSDTGRCRSLADEAASTLPAEEVADA